MTESSSTDSPAVSTIRLPMSWECTHAPGADGLPEIIIAVKTPSTSVFHALSLDYASELLDKFPALLGRTIRDATLAASKLHIPRSPERDSGLYIPQDR